MHYFLHSLIGNIIKRTQILEPSRTCVQILVASCVALDKPLLSLEPQFPPLRHGCEYSLLGFSKRPHPPPPFRLYGKKWKIWEGLAAKSLWKN